MEPYDGSRLTEFRQLKAEIRGSREYLVVGIDIAKERHHAFFGTAMGKTLLRRLVVDNTREGFENLCFHADTLKTRHRLKRVVFGLEPTADYHKPLGEYLITHGYTVVLVAGTAVKRNRELLDGRWDKHDTKDSANVADLVVQGKCLFYEFPPPAIRALRSLLSLKRRLKREEHGYRVRIRNHLIAQYFPEMDHYFSYGEGSAIVRWCLDPGEMAALPVTEFVRRVCSRNGGEAQRRRLGEIHRKAHSSIGCGTNPAVAFEAKLLTDGLRQMQAMLRQIDAEIKDICHGFPEYPCILSIPGFGPDISATVLLDDRQSPPVREREAGAENGGTGSECRAEREDRGCPGALEKRQRASSLLPSTRRRSLPPRETGTLWPTSRISSTAATGSEGSARRCG